MVFHLVLINILGYCASHLPNSFEFGFTTPHTNATGLVWFLFFLKEKVPFKKKNTEKNFSFENKKGNQVNERKNKLKLEERLESLFYQSQRVKFNRPPIWNLWSRVTTLLVVQ